MGGGCTGERCGGRSCPCQSPWKHIGGAEVWLHSFLTLILEGGQFMPQPLYPRKTTHVPTGPQRGSGRFSEYSLASVGIPARTPITTPTALHWLRAGEKLNLTLTGLQMKHAAKHGVWVLQHRVQPRRIVTELASPDTNWLLTNNPALRHPCGSQTATAALCYQYTHLL